MILFLVNKEFNMINVTHHLKKVYYGVIGYNFRFSCYLLKTKDKKIRVISKLLHVVLF